MSKIFVSNCFVEKGATESDQKLIYMKLLNYPLRKIIPFYFDHGIKVLDVTTGEKRMWNDNLYETLTFDGKPYCGITWFDGSLDSKADIVGDFRKLPFPDNSFDLIVFDPPFTEQKNLLEGYSGIKSQSLHHLKPNRTYYSRTNSKKWIPPEAYFFQTWREFNRVSKNGLIVKISERFKNLEEIPVLTYMDLAYNKRFNHKSEFKRCVMVHYRGKRMATGARSGNPQRVLSEYAVYKKDVRKR